MHIQILVYDGYEEMDALGPLAILARAGADGTGFRVEPVRIGTGTVTSTHGLDMHVAVPLDPTRPPALLVVPGARWLQTAIGTPWADQQRLRISKVLAAVHETGTVLAAVGTGALFLASAGILRGRPATTHGHLVDELGVAGARVVRAGVVDDGDVVTSSGVAAGLNLALWLVERYSSSTHARELERELEYEPPPTVWRRSE